MIIWYFCSSCFPPPPPPLSLRHQFDAMWLLGLSFKCISSDCWLCMYLKYLNSLEHLSYLRLSSKIKSCGNFRFNSSVSCIIWSHICHTSQFHMFGRRRHKNNTCKGQTFKHSLSLSLCVCVCGIWCWFVELCVLLYFSISITFMSFFKKIFAAKGIEIENPNLDFDGKTI